MTVVTNVYCFYSLCNFRDSSVNIVNKSKGDSAITAYIKEVMDDSLTWEDVKWLKR